MCACTYVCMFKVINGNSFALNFDVKHQQTIFDSISFFQPTHIHTQTHTHAHTPARTHTHLLDSAFLELSK